MTAPVALPSTMIGTRVLTIVACPILLTSPTSGARDFRSELTEVPGMMSEMLRPMAALAVTPRMRSDTGLKCLTRPSGPTPTIPSKAKSRMARSSLARSFSPLPDRSDLLRGNDGPAHGIFAGANEHAANAQGRCGLGGADIAHQHFNSVAHGGEDLALCFQYALHYDGNDLDVEDLRYLVDSVHHVPKADYADDTPELACLRHRAHQVERTHFNGHYRHLDCALYRKGSAASADDDVYTRAFHLPRNLDTGDQLGYADLGSFTELMADFVAQLGQVGIWRHDSNTRLHCSIHSSRSILACR